MNKSKSKAVWPIILAMGFALWVALGTIIDPSERITNRIYGGSMFVLLGALPIIGRNSLASASVSWYKLVYRMSPSWLSLFNSEKEIERVRGAATIFYLACGLVIVGLGLLIMLGVA